MSDEALIDSGSFSPLDEMKRAPIGARFFFSTAASTLGVRESVLSMHQRPRGIEFRDGPHG